MLVLEAGITLAGRFRLLRPLDGGHHGGGGHGTGTLGVWLAHDSRMDAEVALKIHPGPIPSSTSAAFNRVRRLVHPGIVRLLDLVITEDSVLLSMEPVHGTTLAVLRGAGWREIAAAGLSIADALQYAHAQGVVHGDLKAGNVLRDAPGRCRITDFPLPGLTPANAVSLSTASPAQVDGSPAVPADDVYALGALLYDLVMGHPPLHPHITPARIRTEVPARAGVDGRGETLPLAFVQLLAAMLEKEPARRPAGMAAVRTVLAEVIAGAHEAPAGAASAATAAGGSGGESRLKPLPQRPRPRQPRRGLPAWTVFAGLVLLIAGVIAVLLVLPRVVEQRGAVLTVQRPSVIRVEPGRDSRQPAAEAVADARRAADEALAAATRAQDAARAAGVERWGGGDWRQALGQVNAGDAAYRDRDYARARSSWAAAAKQLQALAGAAPAEFGKALDAGQQALRVGNQAAALAAFDRALTIEPGNDEARRGRQRSERLDEVLRLTADAANQESAGDLAGARRGFDAALAVDPDWPAAREGAARVRAALAAGEFEQQMARGLAALAAGRPAEALPAIERSLRLKPGDPGAQAALAQARAGQRQARIADLEAEAQRLAAGEQWTEAAARYEAMLTVDPAIPAARAGLEKARAQAGLMRDLGRQLQETDRLNDDAVAARAGALLARARAVPDPGPKLAARTDELARALAVASRPVPVVFQSDSRTHVVVFRVGSLGTFDTRTVDLKPGAYVVVGRREGYRDVRRNIRVDAAGNGPVVVRCEEPI